jgi:hypothetical protein
LNEKALSQHYPGSGQGLTAMAYNGTQLLGLQVNGGMLRLHVRTFLMGETEHKKEDAAQ